MPLVVGTDHPSTTIVLPILGLPCSPRIILDVAGPTGEFVTAGHVHPFDLRFAVVTRHGRLHLFRIGESAPQASLINGAAGVGWSNAGDRLAVVVRDPLRLLVYSDELDLLSEFPLDLTPPPDTGYVSFMISWHPDDSAVLASYDMRFVADGVTLERSAALVDLVSSATQTYALSNAFFISPDLIIATPRECFDSGCVRLFTLHDGQLAQGPRIGRTLFALASHPWTGVFATAEELPRFMLPGDEAGLRTLTAGPNIFASGSSSITLIPREIALPILEASGFGPTDAPQPDELGGCPE